MDFPGPKFKGSMAWSEGLQMEFSKCFLVFSLLLYSWTLAVLSRPTLFKKHVVGHCALMTQYTVRFTPKNPRLFRQSILLSFSGSIWATDKPNTNFHILISRAFTWTYQIFFPTNRLSFCFEIPGLHFNLCLKLYIL